MSSPTIREKNSPAASHLKPNILFLHSICYFFTNIELDWHDVSLDFQVQRYIFIFEWERGGGVVRMLILKKKSGWCLDSYQKLCAKLTSK